MGSSSNSNNGSGVPPGFRFHPTDEELLHYYLKKKVSFHKFEMEVIRDIDLNKLEPWDLQEKCRIGSTPQNEWYFFSHKDRKYPTGSRTNRATNAGFWKATGRDKCIRNSFQKIGMRKTLVFYRGRAPHGQKTDWIMHEYRLEDADHVTNEHDHQEEGWVVCRVFKKKNLFKVGGPTNEAGSGGGSCSSASATNNYNINNITNNSTISDHHLVNGNNYHQLLLSGSNANGMNIQPTNQYYNLLRQPAVAHQYLMMQPSFELNNKSVSDHHNLQDLGLHTYSSDPRNHHHQYPSTNTGTGLLSSHYLVHVQPSISSEVATAATTSLEHHHQHHDLDHQPPIVSEWTMLDRNHGTTTTSVTTHLHNHEKEVDDTINNDHAVVLLQPNLSVSLSHNNNIDQLSLRATTNATSTSTTTEMDFWGYAK